MLIRTLRSRSNHLRVLGIVVLLTQISCSSDPSFQVADDHLIVPGERIGPFKLGMTDQELFQVGIPRTTEPLGNEVIYYFGDWVVSVSHESRQVDEVTTWSDSDRTSSAVGVGSTLQDLFRVLGPPDKTDVGWSGCGVPGQVEHVYYGNMRINFNRSGSSCVDAASTHAQAVSIKTFSKAGW
jgi:hypothetical protein